MLERSLLPETIAIDYSIKNYQKNGWYVGNIMDGGKSNNIEQKLEQLYITLNAYPSLRELDSETQQIFNTMSMEDKRRARLSYLYRGSKIDSGRNMLSLTKLENHPKVDFESAQDISLATIQKICDDLCVSSLKFKSTFSILETEAETAEGTDVYVVVVAAAAAN